MGHVILRRLLAVACGLVGIAVVVGVLWGLCWLADPFLDRLDAGDPLATGALLLVLAFLALAAVEWTRHR